MTGPIILAALTYLLMLLAFFWHRMRRFHVAVMASIIVFDVSMPFYLVATRDWKTRLIDDGDILSFGVWMHFGLIVTLFVLYVIQVQTALKMLRAPRQEMDAESREAIRKEHRAQGLGILLARGLVIATGAILADPVAAMWVAED
jgi:type VI protein secretion system component VasK